MRKSNILTFQKFSAIQNSRRMEIWHLRHPQARKQVTGNLRVLNLRSHIVIVSVLLSGSAVVVCCKSSELSGIVWAPWKMAVRRARTRLFVFILCMVMIRVQTAASEQKVASNRNSSRSQSDPTDGEEVSTDTTPESTEENGSPDSLPPAFAASNFEADAPFDGVPVALAGWFCNTLVRAADTLALVWKRH